MWRNGKIQTETLYFFNLCSAAFTMIFFTLGMRPSIHFQPILWKNCFLPKWNIWLKWIKHIPKENHHNKTWLFFSMKIDMESTFFTFTWNSKQVSELIEAVVRSVCKNGVLRNFAKYTRKHLCQRLYFNKVAGSGLELY